MTPCVKFPNKLGYTCVRVDMYHLPNHHAAPADHHKWHSPGLHLELFSGVQQRHTPEALDFALREWLGTVCHLMKNPYYRLKAVSNRPIKIKDDIHLRMISEVAQYFIS